MVIEYLDARGPEGKMFPLHLRSRTFGRCTILRQAWPTTPLIGRRGFLENMPTALGERAMAARDEIRSKIGLDYFGVDFALAADGSVLLFVANGDGCDRPSARADLGLSSRPRCRYTRGREANGAVARPGWRRREVTSSIELRRSR
jgi:hypothetical protein